MEEWNHMEVESHRVGGDGDDGVMGGGDGAAPGWRWWNGWMDGGEERGGADGWKERTGHPHLIFLPVVGPCLQLPAASADGPVHLHGWGPGGRPGPGGPLRQVKAVDTPPRASVSPWGVGQTINQ